ncbi:hypothetical protein E2C01_039235 [Portunus trituberculatus]|uniref:Uncharacterized protein n=1 Tax=Portunus trituberculatus TaxID=210409 RepID=A0A5B7FK47_PORTR|nr:hypothetical protein [Portunus trituberculatus]
MDPQYNQYVLPIRQQSPSPTRVSRASTPTTHRTSKIHRSTRKETEALHDQEAQYNVIFATERDTFQKIATRRQSVEIAIIKGI